jgi:hypothetical protein
MTPFRIAFREEGEFVNAYLATMTTMDGAILLGSLRSAILEHGDAFEEYKAMMRKFAGILCVHTFGVEPSEFIEERAPEHERAGKA